MSLRRALVLGSGGVTGVAWELGVLAGLSRAGLSLDADVVVGTSGGALVGAWLTSGALPGLAEVRRERVGRVGAAQVARLVAAQLHPSRRHAVALLGAGAIHAWTAAAEMDWVGRIGTGLFGLPWPQNLVIVATDAASGGHAFFSSEQCADLAAAVAASCALPGVFPAVRIDGRLYFDGGLRSPANLDVAASADVVIAVAPLSGALRPHRRPVRQAAALTRSGARVVLVEPDLAGRVAMGPDVLSPERTERSYAAGLAAAARHSAEALAAWR